jgi:predicted RND superfamily exporter protein
VNNLIIVQRDYETRSGHLISLFTGFDPSHEGSTRRIPNTMQQVDDLTLETKTQREAIASMVSTVKQLEETTHRKSPARAAAESAFPRPVRRAAVVIVTNPNTYRFLAGMAATLGLTGLSQVLTQLLGN